MLLIFVGRRPNNLRRLFVGTGDGTHTAFDAIDIANEPPDLMDRFERRQLFHIKQPPSDVWIRTIVIATGELLLILANFLIGTDVRQCCPIVRCNEPESGQHSVDDLRRSPPQLGIVWQARECIALIPTGVQVLFVIHAWRDRLAPANHQLTGIAMMKSAGSD